MTDKERAKVAQEKADTAAAEAEFNASLLDAAEAEFNASPDDEPSAPIETNFLEALLRGSAQGLSFGFADEITGGLEALLPSISGSKGSTLAERYKKARDESRAEYNLSQEQYPVTSVVGNVLGGILPAVATGGAAAAPMTAAKAAKLGAAYGAVSGVGTSEATNVGDMAAEVGVSTLLGGGLGLGGHQLAKSGGKLVGRLKEEYSPDIQDVKDFLHGLPGVKPTLYSFKKGKDGKNVYLPGANQEFKVKANEDFKEILNDIERFRRKVGAEKGALTQSTKRVASAKDLDEIRKKIINLRGEVDIDPEASAQVETLLELVDNFTLGPEVRGGITLPGVETTFEDPNIAKVAAKLQQLSAKEALTKNLADERLSSGKKVFTTIDAPVVGLSDEALDTAEAVVDAGRIVKSQATTSPELASEMLNKAATPSQKLDVADSITLGTKVPDTAKTLNALKDKLDKLYISRGDPFETREIIVEGQKYLGVVNKDTLKPASSILYKVSDDGLVTKVERDVVVQARGKSKIDDRGTSSVQELDNLKQLATDKGSKGERPFTVPRVRFLADELATNAKVALDETVEGLAEKNIIYHELKQGMDEKLPGIIDFLSSNDFNKNAVASSGKLKEFIDLVTGKGIDLRKLPSKVVQKLPVELQERLSKAKLSDVVDFSPEDLALIDDSVLPTVKMYQEAYRSARDRLSKENSPLVSKMEDMAMEMGIRGQIAAPGWQGGILGAAIGTVRGTVYAGANIAGALASSAGKLPSQTARFTTTVLGADPKKIDAMAEFVMQKKSGAGKVLGPLLKKVSASSDARKKALLFGIMQNPEYRALMEEATGMEVIEK